MRKYLKITACFTAICMLFTSCSKLIYKHQNFMDGLKTKEDVRNHFGNPNEYRNQGETSEWLYNLENQKKLTTSNPDPVSKTNNTGEGKEVDQFGDLKKKYVLITFNNDLVTKWQSEGVDYTLRKTKPVASILLGAGIGVALVIILLATAETSATF